MIKPNAKISTMIHNFNFYKTVQQLMESLLSVYHTFHLTVGPKDLNKWLSFK